MGVCEGCGGVGVVWEEWEWCGRVGVGVGV